MVLFSCEVEEDFHCAVDFETETLGTDHSQRVIVPALSERAFLGMCLVIFFDALGRSFSAAFG
jgi:hypothetical protein